MAPVPSPIDPFLERQRFLVLDGGLATELERRGIDLRDPLWSARALIEHPEAIRAVHAEYLAAGADLVIAASYQASVEGFLRHGLSLSGAEGMIRRSVTLAREAREEFLAGRRLGGRLPPLVAGSIGPFGAFRHDGSEYRGDYGVGDRRLIAFHAPRLDLLLEAGADLLACETIPSEREAMVLAELLERRPGVRAWLSFSTRDGTAIADGTPLVRMVRALAPVAGLVAVGVNCAPAERITPLLGTMASAGPGPFVVYPNAGGEYHAPSGEWRGEARPGEIPHHVDDWLERGARLIGGCCRTTPGTVAALRERLG